MNRKRRSFLQAGAWAASTALLGACAKTPEAGGVSAQPSPSPPPAPAPSPAPSPAEGSAKEGGKKTILILGGTAFLGPELVEAALARGHTLTLFNRGKTNPQLFPNVEKLKGDRDGDLKALEGRRWDAVIDTSGYVPRIVRASAKLLAPSVKQYIFISSISVYADASKPGVDEGGRLEAVPDPASEDVRKYYGGLKALCEQAAEAEMPGRVTNIRPGLIVGPGDPTDRFTYWPVRVARGGEVLSPGTGEDPVQFIDVRDLAEWIILTIEQGDVGIYNAVGPEGRMTMSELLNSCKAASGSDAKFTWADAKFLEAQKVSGWTDMPVWVAPDADSLGFAQFSRDKAMKRGLRFRSVDVTVKDTLEGWKTLPEERRKKLRSGISPEREAEVLAAFHKSAKGGKKKTGLLERWLDNDGGVLRRASTSGGRNARLLGAPITA